MRTEIVNITPATAENYLRTSMGHRPLRRQVIMSYANTMKAGLWKMNGETICFDKDGHLLNGHHRLEAVKKSGATVPMLIVYGVDDGSAATYDCGKRRTAADVLRIAHQYRMHEKRMQL